MNPGDYLDLETIADGTPMYPSISSRILNQTRPTASVVGERPKLNLFEYIIFAGGSALTLFVALAAAAELLANGGSKPAVIFVITLTVIGTALLLGMLTLVSTRRANAFSDQLIQPGDQSR